LREAVALGLNHIDTADYYGPNITNQIIKAALHPYPRDFVIVTKVGSKRTPDRGWANTLSKEELVSAVHDSLENLGLDALHVVNLRVGGPMGPGEGSIEEPLGVLIDLQKDGLIQQIGISNATSAQVREATAMTNIVCIQNHYNLAHRTDDALIDELAREEIAYTPFFPLGGFRSIQSSKLQEVATEIGKTPMQVALAWLLQRSPNVLLIPGTSSMAHLRENLEVSALNLPARTIQFLNTAIRE
jgi:aryl-alcohol dehydrogenase-like predicted oxidoreductase